MLLALVLDALFGEPKIVWERIPHPVKLLGEIVSFSEKWLNDGYFKKLKGLFFILLAAMLLGVLGYIIAKIPDYGLFEILLVAILLSQKSLIQHAKDVATSLRINVAQGRSALANLVGRDTENLDESEIARATIESMAENFSDGLVAPAFWYLVAGLPGILIYKFINTADSMIGYKNDKYGQFGWAAARIDDVLNYIPARLSGLIIAVSFSSMSAIRVMWQEAKHHRSPNAGWPEAALASVLEIAVSGPRMYEGSLQNYPYVNPAGRMNLEARDINVAISALWRSWIILYVSLASWMFGSELAFLIIQMLK